MTPKAPIGPPNSKCFVFGFCIFFKLREDDDLRVAATFLVEGEEESAAVVLLESNDFV